MEWLIVLLVGVIIALMVWMLFFGGAGVSRQRKLQREVNTLREELQRTHEANEALRGNLGVGGEARIRRHGDLFEFVRDLESLRCAIAGSKTCQSIISKKYDMKPGPKLLERILARPGVDPVVKERLTDELLVGEVGRSLLKSLDNGDPVDNAAANAGVPVVVARGQVTRLQILGYLDARLKLTDQGRDALI